MYKKIQHCQTNCTVNIKTYIKFNFQNVWCVTPYKEILVAYNIDQYYVHKKEKETLYTSL